MEAPAPDRSVYRIKLTDRDRYENERMVKVIDPSDEIIDRSLEVPRAFSSARGKFDAEPTNYNRTVYHFKNPAARARALKNPALQPGALDNAENVTALVKLGVIPPQDVRAVALKVRHETPSFPVRRRRRR